MFVIKDINKLWTGTSLSCGFGHIYWRNPQWKTSFFAQWGVRKLFFTILKFVSQLKRLTLSVRTNRSPSCKKCHNFWKDNGSDFKVLWLPKIWLALGTWQKNNSYTSTRKNGYTLFSQLELFSHINLSRSPIQGNWNVYNIKLIIFGVIQLVTTSQNPLVSLTEFKIG